MALTRNAFLGRGASIGTFAVAAMRSAFNVAYRFPLTEKRGGAAPIIEHQAVSDVFANAKGKIEAVRLLSWRPWTRCSRSTRRRWNLPCTPGSMARRPPPGQG